MQKETVRVLLFLEIRNVGLLHQVFSIRASDFKGSIFYLSPIQKNSGTHLPVFR